MSIHKALIIGIVTVTLSACAMEDPNRRAKTGAAVGAVVGAILGHQLDDDKGRFVGAAVGAIAGATVGNYMDKQQQEFERELAEEQRQHALEIERINDDTLKLIVSSEVSFDVDSDRIKPAFQSSLNKLADVLIKYDRTVIHVIGHTDSTGAASYNLDLSKRRAKSVSHFLAHRGVPDDRLRFEGWGETHPRTSNDTESGRQLNRRVEIFVKPIIEGREASAYESPQIL